MMKKAWDDSTMMRAARCQKTESVPVWLMRQAGRYMEEYRKIRERVSFLELCKTPELAAEVMITAVQRLGVDAGIIFSDILLILEPMGLELEFEPEGGPKIRNPIRKSSDVELLRELESIEPLEFVMNTVRYTREGLDDSLPLIGFAGAPFTLAAYAIEGNSSRNFRQVKAFMHVYPTEWQEMMTKFAVSTARYLNSQINAGVQLVQIFDSWIGCLSGEDYKKYVKPYSRMLIDLIVPGTPIIHFGPGNPVLLPDIRDAGGHVIGIDWRVSVNQAWEIIGANYAIQGNLDPAILLTNREIIRQSVQHLLRQVERRPGFIFNLGHGIMPQTPVENAIALVDAVHEFGVVR
ncbi:MAG: uroporphyrinogen decarboxylase [Planctomycetaceae bacterium]|jgi:uroporphyrinogen decarboxylase|nr:uroporphyrinogen decarboxylase [Planctomycetaceae bacterium]